MAHNSLFGTESKLFKILLLGTSNSKSVEQVNMPTCIQNKHNCDESCTTRDRKVQDVQEL